MDQVQILGLMGTPAQLKIAPICGFADIIAKPLENARKPL
jgi:hypothetical protein